ncbi:hypothetical protein GCM10022221_72710 [Actinocorallia aurea]
MPHDLEVDGFRSEALGSGPRESRRTSVLRPVLLVVAVVGIGLVVRAFAAPEDGIPDDPLKPGSCLDLAFNTKGEIASRKPVSCTEPHWFQVLSVEVLPDGPYPGYETLHEQADEACGTRWNTTVRQSPYALSHQRTVLVPTADRWPADRITACALFSFHAPTTTPAILPPSAP